MSLRKIVHGVIAIVIMLAGITPANAQEVNLTCTSAQNGSEMRVTINESAGTAVVEGDPVSQAKFTDTTVSWNVVREYPRSRVQVWLILSRETGTLRQSTSTPPSQWEHHCTVAKKQF